MRKIHFNVDEIFLALIIGAVCGVLVGGLAGFAITWGMR